MRITKRLDVTPAVGENENWRMTCASICRTPGGDLVAAWYGGPSHPEAGSGDPHGRVYRARLVGGGAAWSEPAAAESPPGIAALDPMLVEYPAEVVTCVFSLQTHCRWGEVGGAYMHMSRSHDHGVTWSPAEPMRGVPPARNQNKPFVSGDLCVLPTALELPAGAPARPVRIGSGIVMFRDVLVLRSTDGGSTWDHAGVIRAPDGTRLMEPATVALTNGDLLIYLRSAPGTEGDLGWPPGKPGRIWETRSSDEGRTWAEPVRADLPNNNSGFDMCRAANGRLYIAYNNHSRLRSETGNPTSSRFPLMLAESPDDGETWRDVLTLDPGPDIEVSYASLIADPQGPLDCVYTWDRRAIKHVRVDPG